MSDVLIALSGAVAGALLALLFTVWREARQRSRERAGLANLIYAEIGANLVVLQVRSPHELIDPGSKERGPWTLKRDVWLAVRTRMAQLASRERFNTLAAYYRELGQLMEMETTHETGAASNEAVTVQDATDKIHTLQELQWIASRELEWYIDPPWYEKWFGIGA